ncbi:MAG: HIT family protein [Polyangiaceae bacterium]|nr:HIT family protein [Polyangiaceae bacterium]
MVASSCIFCKIAAGDLAASIVYEDSDRIAFLDHRPVFPGHCLLVPRRHYATLLDCPNDEIGPLFTCAKRIARAVEKGLQADGFFVGINNRVSQSVPHVHIHIIPRRKKDGLRGFFWPRIAYSSDAEMERIRAAVAAELEG